MKKILIILIAILLCSCGNFKEKDKIKNLKISFLKGNYEVVGQGIEELRANASELEEFKELEREYKEYQKAVEKEYIEQQRLAKEKIKEEEQYKLQLIENLSKAINRKLTGQSEIILEELKTKFPSVETIEFEEGVNKIKEKEKSIKKQELEKKEAEKQKESKRKALIGLEKEYDEFQNVTWFYPKNSFKYSSNIKKNMFLYAGGNGRNPSPQWTRLIFKYSGNNWIFFKKIIILADGDRYEFNFNYDQVKRDNSSSYVYEKVDVTPQELGLSREKLLKIANSKNLRIRFEGDNKNRDFEINNESKKAMKEILDATY